MLPWDNALESMFEWRNDWVEKILGYGMPCGGVHSQTASQESADLEMAELRVSET